MANFCVNLVYILILLLNLAIHIANLEVCDLWLSYLNCLEHIASVGNKSIFIL